MDISFLPINGGASKGKSELGVSRGVRDVVGPLGVA